MEDQYPNQPEGTDVYDEPSDDDLKRIEDELLDSLDLFWTQNILRRPPPQKNYIEVYHHLNHL